MPDAMRPKSATPILHRSRRRGDRGKGLAELVGGDRLDAEEVEKLRQVRLPPPDGRFRIESLDHLWAAVGRFGLSEVAQAAELEPAHLRKAVADLASEEIEGASSLVRRSLDRWRRRWPWRVTAILFLLVLGAGSLFLETRSTTTVAGAPVDRVVLTLPVTPESLPEARPGEQISLLLTAPSAGTVAVSSLPGFLENVVLVDVRRKPIPAFVVAVPTELLRSLPPLPAGLRATVVRPFAADEVKSQQPDSES